VGVLSRRVAIGLPAGLAGGLLALELSFRLLEGPLGVDRERLARFRGFVRTGGEQGQYEPRPHSLYVRSQEDPKVNSLGFLDEEFRREKTPGTLRIACLGSSTTEGGNAAQHEGSYPYFLGRILRERGGSPVETLNFGMSGWTSAEMLVNYVLVVQDFDPDLVLIHEAVNDVEPRAWPRFAADYSHYRRHWRDVLLSPAHRALLTVSDLFAVWQLRGDEEFGLAAAVNQLPQGPYRFADGRLPPETAAPFKRNVRTIAEHVRVRGGHAALVTMPYDSSRAKALPLFRAGLDEHNAILRELAREQDLLLVDLDALAHQRPERWRKEFLDLVHLTPEGNRLKAEAIADALLASWPRGAPGR
jgi:lysophospholipase L1-like esterase